MVTKTWVPYMIRLGYRGMMSTFYDWFHTTGSLVVNREGRTSKVTGVYLTSQEVINYVYHKEVKPYA